MSSEIDNVGQDGGSISGEAKRKDGVSIGGEAKRKDSIDQIGLLRDGDGEGENQETNIEFVGAVNTPRKRARSGSATPGKSPGKNLAKLLRIDMNFSVGNAGQRVTRTKYKTEVKDVVVEATVKDESDNESDAGEEKAETSNETNGQDITDWRKVIGEILQLHTAHNVDLSFEGSGQSQEYVDAIKELVSRQYELPSKEDVEYIKKQVLSKLLGARPVPLDQYIPFIKRYTGLWDTTQNTNIAQNSLMAKLREVYTFLEHSIVNGASSSCLLIGGKKSGKSLVLENALQKLSLEYNSGKNKTFMTIRLSGLLQTDDKMAVREIARQLDAHLRMFGKDGKFGDLYSEQEEYSEPEEDEYGIDQYIEDKDQVISVGSNSNEHAKGFEKRSISETFSSILASLEQVNFGESNQDTKPVALVFVIDEFERFTVRNRQTLLYNLFDLASSSHTIPISVVGLTTKVNIRDQLEKRVSSRFSQRIIHFFGYIEAKTAKLVLINYHVNSEAEYFWFDLRCNLCLTTDEITNPKFCNKKYALLWNDYINSLFYHDNFAHGFKQLVLKNFITIKNQKELLNSFVFPLTSISTENPFPIEFTKYNQINNFNNFDFKSNILKTLLNESLSDLQLFLVVCSARVIYKLDLNFVNFNLCYEEYQKSSKALNDQRNTTFVLNANKSVSVADTGRNGLIGSRTWSKSACKHAWEKLEELGLIIAPSNGRSVTAAYKKTNGAASNDNYDTKFFQLQVDMNDLFALIKKGNPLRKFTRV